MSNLRQLPNVEVDEMIASLEKMKRLLPHIIEYNKLDSKIRREKFLALLDEGFDPQQALELCK